MGNKDIHEWLLDENIDSAITISNKNGETVFLTDILEKHLKQQLQQVEIENNVILIEFVKDVKHMMKLYAEGRYTKSEQWKNKLAERLDHIMMLNSKY